MSTSSDSEDESQKQKFLDAADTTLFSNSMFQRTEKPASPSEATVAAATTKDPLPKSQRYLHDECNFNDADITLPAEVQKHISKKLSELISQRIQFSNVIEENPPRQKKLRSRVKLLQGDECYVKPYEEFEYETSGPTKKPTIKRREVEREDVNESARLESVAVDVDFVHMETKTWQPKPESKDKVFHYRESSDGKLHAKERINEFTQMRKKNKWTENKIRLFKHKAK